MTSTQEKRKPKKSSWVLNFIVVLLIIAIWGGIVYSAYYYARQYIDLSIQMVQQTNAMNVQIITDRLDTLGSEITKIREALQDTGKTISSSTSTQEELSDKINKLDKQLQELEKSLKILREAPDASEAPN